MTSIKADDGVTPQFLTMFPTEIVLEVLHQLPLDALINLSSTCRTFRAALMDTSVLDRWFCRAIVAPHGPLRWILPVSAVPCEPERAAKALATWMDSSLSTVGGKSPIESPSFPCTAFVRACFDSDSMMNRKRLWGVVKQ